MKVSSVGMLKTIGVSFLHVEMLRLDALIVEAVIGMDWMRILFW